MANTFRSRRAIAFPDITAIGAIIERETRQIAAEMADAQQQGTSGSAYAEAATSGIALGG